MYKSIAEIPINLCITKENQHKFAVKYKILMNFRFLSNGKAPDIFSENCVA